jgi:hypothetical protein
MNPAILALPMLATQTANVVTIDLDNLKRQPIATIEQRRTAWDQLHAVAAIQGIVNRNSPQLYIYWCGKEGWLDRFWMNRIDGRWVQRQSPTINSVDDLLIRFRKVIKGVVVWDEKVPATANLASTAAGLFDLIPIRYDLNPGSLYMQWTQNTAGPKLPIKQWLIEKDGTPKFKGGESRSPKNEAYRWAISQWIRPGRCNPKFLAYYPDAFWLSTPRDVPLERTLLSNHDFFISQRAFFFDLGPWDDEAPDDDLQQIPGTDARTLRELLLANYRLNKGRFTHVGGFTPWDQKYTDHTGRKHGAVASEWRYAEILSCFNAYMDADAAGLHAMANASVFTHQPIPRVVKQRHQVDLTPHLDANEQVKAQHYVAIYGGDYDSAAWLYSRLPEMWLESERGDVPIGWPFNPALQERFPTGLLFARETATANDAFIAGDSGMGYLNPGYLVPPRRWSDLPSGLKEWEKLNRIYYQRWDLDVTGFVIDGNAPPMSTETLHAYARFSPGGVVAQKIPILSLVEGVPFIRMGADITRNDESSAQLVLERQGGSTPSFSIHRTILWSPSDLKKLVMRLEALPNTVVVDPRTLLALAKKHQQKVP